jgi:hypothetical protein
MSELRNNASSLNGQSPGLAVHVRNLGEELAARADVMLARYPAPVREQITDLLRVPCREAGRGR